MALGHASDAFAVLVPPSSNQPRIPDAYYVQANLELGDNGDGFSNSICGGYHC